MDDLNITIEEYTRLKEEKAQKRRKLFNWKTAKYDMAPLPPRDQRHLWIRYQVKGYTKKIVYVFEQRLEMIFGRHVNRVHILDFRRLTLDMRRDLAKRLRMVYTKDNTQEVFGVMLGGGLHTTKEMAEDRFGAYWSGRERVIPDKGDLSDYLVEISSGRDFLRGAPSYTYIIDPVWRLCHKLISYNISGRGQVPKKYYFRHIEGRNRGARLSGGHFIWHLSHHFGLVIDDGLRGLTVITRNIPLIDMVNEGALADPTPMQEPQPPPPPPTIEQRLATYCCWYKLKLLDDATDIKLRLLEQSAAAVQLVSAVQIVNTVSIRANTVMYNEFDLWKMRIEQYFLMTDYSLWEVILNGDSLIPARVIDGVVMHVASTTDKQRLDMKNELKARGTLLMALPDKHQLNFNIHKDAKTLILKIYEAEVKSSSSTSPTIQNIAFVSSQNSDSTNESVSAVATVSAASAKVPVSALSNMDTLSDAMAMLTMRAMRFLQRTGKNLRANGTTSIGFDITKWSGTIDTGEGTLQESCDGVGSYDLRFQAEEEPTNYPLMTFTSSSSFSSNTEVASYSKACTKAYATLQSHYDKLTNDLRKSQFDVISYKTGLESVEARILVYQQNETIFEEDIKLLKLDVQLRDNALVDLRKKFEKAEQERDELKLKLDKFQTSSKNLSQLLASQTNDKTGLGYDNQVFNSSAFDCDEMFSSKSDVSMPASPVYDRPTAPIIEDWVSDSEDEYQVENPILAVNIKTYISKPKGHGNSRNRKACFVCKSFTHLINDRDNYEKKMVQTPARNHAQRGNHQLYKRMTHPNPHRHMVPTTILTRSKLGNPQHALKDKGVIDSGCSRHMTGNMSYLSDFEEINGGYVAFGRNPKGDKITGKELNHFYGMKWIKREFSVPRTPQQNDIDERKNKTLVEAARTILADSLLPIPFWAEAVNTACYVQNRVLVTKPHNKTPYELLLGRTPSIGFMRPFGCPVTILNTLDPLGKFDRKADEGFLVGYSESSKAFRVFNSRNRIVQETLHINVLENKPNVTGSRPRWLFDIDTLIKSMNYQPIIAGNQPNPSADPHNTDDDATFEVKELEFEVEKPESEVHVSPSSSAKTKKHDDKTKREAKGKSPIDLLIGFRNLNEEFEYFSENSINEVNSASTPVPAVGQISTNDTNTFSAAGPFNTAVNVSAKADFFNLETNITVSHIPTTRVHKDHHVTQIIGDLSLATQTRSMTRMVKDQGGLTQINNEDFYTCMFGCFLSQKEPKRVHQALKDPSWIEAMQEELLQFKMQKVWVLVDLRNGFEDLDYPNKVYEVVKALYGLHQAPRAWYETLANYLLENGFQRGKIDQTLFIKKQKDDILLVQVYVDDIIFGSTNKDLCKAFEKLMKDKF
nr:putative ribonuclease H-like domain-containing protein [Tanacetum cinerariifolium]